MSKVCPICSKGTLIVGKYSTKVRATKFNPRGKRRVYPNLQWARFLDGSREKICTGCLKKNKHLA